MYWVEGCFSSGSEASVSVLRSIYKFSKLPYRLRYDTTWYVVVIRATLSFGGGYTGHIHFFLFRECGDRIIATFALGEGFGGCEGSKFADRDLRFVL